MFRSFAVLSTLLNQKVLTSSYNISGQTLYIGTETDYNNYESDLIDKVLEYNITKIVINADGWSNTDLAYYGYFDTIQEVVFQGNDAITVESLFSGNEYIQKVTFDTPNIVNISDNCFTNSSIKSVNITLVPQVGMYCFYGCQYLQEIICPKLQRIPQGFASFAGSLTTVDISGATQIDPNAFSYCQSLTQITFSSNITNISDNAFAYSAITSIEFPNSIENIGNGAFMNTLLGTVTFPNWVVTGNLTIQKQAFTGTQIQTLLVPNYVTFVDDSNSVTGYFSESYNLTSIEIDLIEIPAGFAMNCFALTTLKAPYCEVIKSYAFFHCKLLETITLSSAINSIGSYSFAYCHKLSYTLPSQNITFGDYSFIYCHNVIFDEVNSQWSLGMYDFVGCEGITQLRVNSTLTSSNIGCFQGCPNIKSIQVDTNFIPSYFFANCV